MWQRYFLILASDMHASCSLWNITAVATREASQRLNTPGAQWAWNKHEWNHIHSPLAGPRRRQARNDEPRLKEGDSFLNYLEKSIVTGQGSNVPSSFRFLTAPLGIREKFH